MPLPPDPHNPVHPSLPSAARLLSPNGPIAAALTEAGIPFEPRPQQLDMARAVEESFAAAAAAAAAPSDEALPIDDDFDAATPHSPSPAQPTGPSSPRHLIVEAGTGVGKSFAYLVPAILRCILHGETVVVATNTIALQEQLIQKDIPLLQRTMDRWADAGVDPALIRADLHPVLVKGRGNYVSLRRLQLASRRSLTLFPDERSRAALHAIEDWAYTTTDGSLSSLPPIERPAVWDRVQSDAGNCMGRSCPQYKNCFYQKARRDMERGNLLICNHAVYFSDLALRAATEGQAGFLPDYHHVILDEAHCIEDVACDHFGLSLTESKVAHLLGVLYHHRTGRGYLANVQLRAGDTDLIDAAHRAVLEAEDAARAFFDSLGELQRRTGLPGGRLPGRSTADSPIENPLSPAMRSLVLRLKALREGLGGVGSAGGAGGGGPDEGNEDKFELNSYILRAGSIADEAEALVGQSVPGCVYWIEGSDEDESNASGRTRGTRRKVRLACSPIEIGPILREHLFSRSFSVVMTSATLSTRRIAHAEPTERAETAFAHFAASVGCDLGASADSPAAAKTLQLDSPFDFAKQVRLYIDLTMPEPSRGGSAARTRQSGGAGGHRHRREETDWPPPQTDDQLSFSRTTDPYIDALVDRIIGHVTATDGGAFVLFTSFQTLYACADALRRPMADQDRPLFVQGRGGSRSQLLEQFRADERSVLLGAASFWQGVDVRGRALRNVIIARLPFDPPDRPLTQARNERIQSRGGNAFMEDSLPRAIIRFKQGFGRLIRSQTDSGRVVVLDPRIATARYGRMFVDALPEGVRVEVVD